MIDVVLFDGKFEESGRKLGFNKIICIDKRFIKSSDDDRRVFEKNKNIFIYNLEDKNRDFIHYRNSGLNQVLCKLAKKNDIAICFNFQYYILY